MPFEHEVAVARELAQEAGAVAQQLQRQGVQTEQKADDSPVTSADRASEALIVRRLTEIFPEDGILGEEGANRQGTSGRRWIIDPIDGTKDFIRGIPLWSVLIGLEEDGKVVAGAAYCPGQNLLAWASLAGGAWANNRQIHVADRTDPRRAILSFNGFNKAGIDPFASRLLSWTRQFWAVRGLGGAYDALLLAQGQADVWIEPSAAPWDLAPLKIIVEEAGAKFADFRGANTIYGGNAYACVPGLEEYVQTLFREK